MKMKKVLQGTALTALAAAACVGVGSIDASAAPAGTYKYNDPAVTSGAADGPQLSVAADGAKEVMFGIATYNNNKKTVKIADNAWDVYDVDGSNPVVIDLSKISNTKDAYFAIKTEKASTPIYYKLAASVSKQKVTYDVSKQTAKVEVQKSSDTAKTPSFEYRTQYGKWLAFTSETTSLKAYQAQGATLYVRAAAGAATGTENVKDISKKKDGEDTAVTVLGYLPGKETKLNIAKQANGPTVTLDYVKGTVKLPKDTEYRFLTSTDGTSFGNASTPAPAETDVKGVSTYFASNTSAKAIALEVHKKATDKKPASKWTHIDLVKPEAIVSPAPNATEVPKDGLEVANVAKITYDTDKNGKYSTKKSVTIENKVDGAINVVIGEESKVPDETEKSAKAIKKGGKASIKVETGKVVYARKAGDKSTSTWASAYTNIGKINIPADPTPTPEATKAP